MNGIMSGSVPRDQADIYFRQLDIVGIDAAEDNPNELQFATDPDVLQTYAIGLGYLGASAKKKLLSQSEARALFTQLIKQALAAAFNKDYAKAQGLVISAKNALYKNGFALRPQYDKPPINQVIAMLPTKYRFGLSDSEEFETDGLGDLGHFNLIPGRRPCGGTSFAEIVLYGFGLGVGIWLAPQLISFLKKS